MNKELEIFAKIMGFKKRTSFMAVTEYSIYCSVPWSSLFNSLNFKKWEDTILPKIEKQILSENGPTLIAIYKVKRFTFPRKITIQPKRLVFCLWLVIGWLMRNV